MHVGILTLNMSRSFEVMHCKHHNQSTEAYGPLVLYFSAGSFTCCAEEPFVLCHGKSLSSEYFLYKMLTLHNLFLPLFDFVTRATVVGRTVVIHSLSIFFIKRCVDLIKFDWTTTHLCLFLLFSNFCELLSSRGPFSQNPSCKLMETLVERYLFTTSPDHFFSSGCVYNQSL